MLIQLLQILPDGSLLIKPIKSTGEFPEKPPEQGKKYIIYFEKQEKDPEPGFNSN